MGLVAPQMASKSQQKKKARDVPASLAKMGDCLTQTVSAQFNGLLLKMDRWIMFIVDLPIIHGHFHSFFIVFWMFTMSAKISRTMMFDHPKQNLFTGPLGGTPRDQDLPPYIHWIGLRENLQETIVFTILYRGSL